MDGWELKAKKDLMGLPGWCARSFPFSGSIQTPPPDDITSSALSPSTPRMIGFSIAMFSKSLEGRRNQGHCTVLIDLGGELTEWCRRELGPAGFEVVHAGFQGGDIRFEGVDALVELRK